MSTTLAVVPQTFDVILEALTEQGTLRAYEADQVRELLDPDFDFSEIATSAASVHVHVKVDDITDVPDELLRNLGPEGERRTPGYVRYSFTGGLNMIFSSYTLAQDDLIPGAVQRQKPFVDHIGLDLRDEGPSTRAHFEAIPDVAVRSGWRHKNQAGPVYCCYAEVGEKNWAYPPEGALGARRPVEFAFGNLKVYDSHVGCDLRPIDPAHPLADQAEDAACGPAHYAEES
ncbi:MAG: hypothetical protein HKN44_11370 [Ilumatobacter sp.]|nr:hypothetical protein [Ilumatobacter sp.]